ncbi:MAG: bifunctional DNA-formamidopyrimidine glycosylase/DNA-(apurinic or apyrimidinic site) lyase [Pseudodesulfovibrio sp.]|uniref:Formamidopyrimidine-DNA glycosylase n=1 Tax=Pseudodesulfovibrio aespoeensis (strain ATCC 700646 / DSM 10631 / Aspo-2) TaxID=643562 RepID=E6VUL2_PSEA9|nr:MULTISPECIES: bifunctional DNA-formamidopyrimidine glycosylase/DNA-(apurinic or apyrimidinic site) lyase [Pseudodesulfovibrio]MBU4191095.1 bifunctional DNA-formamidopyrimidine glycosylase/DNA-(apurinic or apyrimidinic site) lyase [Pseudomonadota bacterium]ADU61157.1 formamidopyrimidine-DNA glycosylase [Pseudodesulfovibrio aespoeensis Aspo-2]MBU4243659.1 bifunctional DNA-formamidopyrimidine glycosylase/DNA-(apurinic or apyrimidinic site) lyase [Pseudomonadota bacterium]MBU4379164.1 bifunction
MPELPEVEVIARGLHAVLVGRVIAAVEPVDPTRLSEDGAALAAKVVGAGVVRVSRRAKVLLIGLGNGATLAFHLKMTGRVVHGPMRPVERHDRTRFILDDGSLLCFADMRRFGYVRAFAPGGLETWDFLCRVGPEPLDTPPAALAGRVLSRSGRIKALLLDQAVVAGVGNIYADESLHRAGIHPQTRGNRLGRAGAERLFAHLQDVLRQAIAENGSSIRDYVNASGDAGAFQNSFAVYGRKGSPCAVCGAILFAVKVAGRTSTFCPRCQPEP